MKNWKLYFVVVLFLFALLFGLTRHADGEVALDRNLLGIYMTECLEQGHSPAACYWSYVDAVEYGSINLELPTDWC